MTNNSDIKSRLKNFNVKSRTINHYNANFTGNATKEYRFEYEGCKYKVYGFEKVIIIEADIDTSVIFTVNISDKVCSLNQPAGKVADKNIYTCDYDTGRSFECACLISDFIKRLDLNSDEGIIVCKNGIQLAINSLDKILDSLAILNNLIKTIETHFPGEATKKTDISQIPDNLRSLIPYLEEWAISDDENRQIKIASSSKRELKHLIDEISPKINQINQYLDSFGERPLTPEAILIGQLGELIDEITSD